MTQCHCVVLLFWCHVVSKSDQWEAEAFISADIRRTAAIISAAEEGRRKQSEPREIKSILDQYCHGGSWSRQRLEEPSVPTESRGSDVRKLLLFHGFAFS